MEEEYKYYAFISYKREDEKQAKWLQNKLEHYKLPTIVRTENPSLPETIYPIFRDTTDLSGGFLAGAIEDALKSSKYLIVVCSPRAAQSQWVCKEVQYFIDSGREKYIIPFIIDGEPNSKNIAEECFPENLRNLSGEKEILGINISEMGRDASAIKVVARMFDLRFDTLWQRWERAKKIKRIRNYTISLFLTSISLIVGAVIYQQNTKLKAINHEIQVNLALKNIELGDNLTAKKTIAMLYKDCNDEELTSIANAEYVARTSYWNSIKPGVEGYFFYEFEEYFEIIPNSIVGNFVGLYFKDDKKIVVFNTQKGIVDKEIKIDCKEDAWIDVTSYNPISNIAVYTVKNTEMYIRDIITNNNIISPIVCKSGEEIFCHGVSMDQNRIVYTIFNLGGTNHYVKDVSKNTTKVLFDGMDGMYGVSKDGGFAVMGAKNDDKIRVVLYDFTKEKVKPLPIYYKYNGFNLAMGDEYIQFYETDFNSLKKLTSLYDINQDTLIDTSIPLEFSTSMITFSPSKDSFVVCQDENKLDFYEMVLSESDASDMYLKRYSDPFFSMQIDGDVEAMLFNMFGTQLVYKSKSDFAYRLGVVNVNLKKNLSVKLVTGSGEKYLKECENGVWELREVSTDKGIGNSINMTTFNECYPIEIDDDNNLLVSLNSELLVMNPKKKQNVWIPCEGSEIDLESGNGRLFVAYTNNSKIEAYDINNGELLVAKEFDDTYISSPRLIRGKNLLAIASRFGVMFLDSKTLDVRNVLNIEEKTIFEYIGISNDETLIAPLTYDKELKIYDLDKLEVVSSIKLPYNISYVSCSFSADNKYICVAGYGGSCVYNIASQRIVLEMNRFCSFCGNDNKLYVEDYGFYDFPTMEELREYYKTWQ